MLKILIIGGCGYIGSIIANNAILKNYNVVVLDNCVTGSQRLLNQKIKFIKGDITNYQCLDNLFLNNKFDLVIHVAAKLIVSESVKNPLDYYFVNVGGMINVLKIMNKYNVKKIIFSSTAAVYGNVDSQKPIKEDADPIPINPYGASKLVAENLLNWSQKAYDINYIIFRYFNVAGASDDLKRGIIVKNPTHLIPTVNNLVLGNINSMKVFGNNLNTFDGTCIRDYVHVEDIALAHIKGIEWLRHFNQSQLFNLGSSYGYSVNEVIEIAKKNTNNKLNIIYTTKRDGDPEKLVANSTKANKLLNWKCMHNLKDMINSDFKWRKKL